MRNLVFAIGVAAMAAWFGWGMSHNSYYGLDEWGVFLFIALISWRPLAIWLEEGMSWFPAAETFFALHIPYYVGPFVSGHPDIVNYDSHSRFMGGVVVALFLTSCYIPYRSSLRRSSKGVSARSAGILDRRFGVNAILALAWAGVAVWSISAFALTLPQLDVLPALGSTLNTVRTIADSGGLLGLFVLSYTWGVRRLAPVAKAVFLVVFLGTEALNLTTGFLAAPVTECLFVIMAFALGRKRIPYLLLVTTFLIASFLHIGKGDMRAKFWDEDKNYSSAGNDPIEVMNFWADASWSHLAGQGSEGEQGSSFVDRGDLLHFEIPVVAGTPSVFPYMLGQTYFAAAAIFVPRLLWPEKPIGNSPDIMLAVYYGIQTEESAEITSIGLGRISESWANFGWLGVIAVGAATGLLFRIPAWLSVGAKPTEPRYLLSLPFAIFAMDLEHCFGSALHSLCLSLLVTAGVLWIFRVLSSDPDKSMRPLAPVCNQHSAKSS
jgi:hypothetical protein